MKQKDAIGHNVHVSFPRVKSGDLVVFGETVKRPNKEDVQDGKYTKEFLNRLMCNESH